MIPLLIKPSLLARSQTKAQTNPKASAPDTWLGPKPPLVAKFDSSVNAKFLVVRVPNMATAATPNVGERSDRKTRCICLVDSFSWAKKHHAAARAKGPER